MAPKQNKKKLLIAITAGVFASLIIFSTMGNFNKKIQEQNALINSLTEKTKDTVKEQFNPKKNWVKVVVAKDNLPAGSKLTPEMLEMKDFDPSAIQQDSINEISLIVGTTIGNRVTAGSIITRSLILEFNKKILEIPPGMRAVTIPMEFIQGFASYITVGSKIDIISLTSNNEGKSNMIVQNAKIIAFEQAAQVPSDTGVPPVTAITGMTLQIYADQAPKLVEAMAKGKLQVAARNDNDNKQVVVKVNPPKTANAPHIYPKMNTLPMVPAGTSTLPSLDVLSKGLGDLPGAASPPRKSKSAKPPKKVEFIQGNVKSNVNLEN